MRIFKYQGSWLFFNLRLQSYFNRFNIVPKANSIYVTLQIDTTNYTCSFYGPNGQPFLPVAVDTLTKLAVLTIDIQLPISRTLVSQSTLLYQRIYLDTFPIFVFVSSHISQNTAGPRSAIGRAPDS